MLPLPLSLFRRVSLSGHKKHSCWKLRLLDCDRIECVCVGGLGTLCSLGTYNVFTGHDYNEGDDDMALIRRCAVSNPKALILNNIDLLRSGILLLVLVFAVYHCAYFFPLWQICSLSISPCSICIQR